MPVLASLGGNPGIPVNLDSPDTCQLKTHLTHGNRDSDSRLTDIYSTPKIKEKHKDRLTPFLELRILHILRRGLGMPAVGM